MKTALEKREANNASQRARRSRIRAAHAAGMIEVPDGKKCARCGDVQLASNFSRSMNSHDGLYGHCRTCDGELSRARVERYKDEDLTGWQERRAATVRKYRHGMTDEDYRLLAEAQEFSCAICGSGDEKLCVDHDHHTGAIRGLLCKNCNSGIGMLGDSPKRLATALAYLLERSDDLSHV